MFAYAVTCCFLVRLSTICLNCGLISNAGVIVCLSMALVTDFDWFAQCCGWLFRSNLVNIFASNSVPVGWHHICLVKHGFVLVFVCVITCCLCLFMQGVLLVLVSFVTCCVYAPLVWVGGWFPMLVWWFVQAWFLATVFDWFAQYCDWLLSSKVVSTFTSISVLVDWHRICLFGHNFVGSVVQCCGVCLSTVLW